jgi:hypothetical protein
MKFSLKWLNSGTISTGIISIQEKDMANHYYRVTLRVREFENDVGIVVKAKDMPEAILEAEKILLWSENLTITPVMAKDEGLMNPSGLPRRD